jgi:hypothetical protein
MSKNLRQTAQKIDKFARWLFPIGYYPVLVIVLIWGIAVNAE